MCRIVVVAVVGFEDRLDGSCEQAGDAKCEGEAGVVPAGLEGVDGLAGNVEPVG